MTIEQLDKLDIIGTDDSNIELVISDHLKWDNKNEKLLLLQDKLNLYLSFIESGEIYEHYPKAVGLPVKISIVSKYQPNSEAVKFLSLAAKTIKDAGFELSHEVKSSN